MSEEIKNNNEEVTEEQLEEVSGGHIHRKNAEKVVEAKKKVRKVKFI